MGGGAGVGPAGATLPTRMWGVDTTQLLLVSGDANPHHFFICFLSDLIPIADADDLAALLG